MKRLVLCFDGTWEARASSRRRVGDYPTNVEKTHIAISKNDANGILQIIAYYRGIGTSRVSHFWGGMTGAGYFADYLRCIRLHRGQFRDRTGRAIPIWFQPWGVHGPITVRFHAVGRRAEEGISVHTPHLL
jgi:hypothetical protein